MSGKSAGQSLAEMISNFTNISLKVSGRYGVDSQKFSRLRSAYTRSRVDCWLFEVGGVRRNSKKDSANEIYICTSIHLDIPSLSLTYMSYMRSNRDFQHTHGIVICWQSWRQLNLASKRYMKRYMFMRWQRQASHEISTAVFTFAEKKKLLHKTRCAGTAQSYILLHALHIPFCTNKLNLVCYGYQELGLDRL